MNRNSHRLTTTKHHNTQFVRIIRNEHNFTATKDQFCDPPTIYWSFTCAFTEGFWSHSFACTLHHLIVINCADVSEGIELPKCVSGTFCWVCFRFFSTQQCHLYYPNDNCQFTLVLATLPATFASDTNILAKVKMWQPPIFTKRYQVVRRVTTFWIKLVGARTSWDLFFHFCLLCRCWK